MRVTCDGAPIEYLPFTEVTRSRTDLQPMTAVEDCMRDLYWKKSVQASPRTERGGHSPGQGVNITSESCSRRPCSNLCSLFSSIAPSSRHPNVDRSSRLQPAERVVISNSRLRPHAGCCFKFRRMAIQLPRQLLLPGKTHLGKPMHQPIKTRT